MKVEEMSVEEMKAQKERLEEHLLNVTFQLLRFRPQLNEAQERIAMEAMRALGFKR